MSSRDDPDHFVQQMSCVRITFSTIQRGGTFLNLISTPIINEVRPLFSFFLLLSPMSPDSKENHIADITSHFYTT